MEALSLSWRIALTAADVRSLPRTDDHRRVLEEEGRIEYTDIAGPKGFRLRITKGGERTFCLVYRRKGSRRSLRETFGQVGEMVAGPDGKPRELTLIYARELADDFRSRVRAGRDFQAERLAPTVGDVLSAFIEAKRQAYDAKTIEGYDQTLRAFQGLEKDGGRVRGAREILEAKASEIDGQTFRTGVKKVTTGPVMQNRHLQRLKAALRWYASENRLALPPIVSMRRPHAEPPKERVLSNDEIRALWQAAEMVIPLRQRSGLAVCAAARFFLVTGQRLNETLQVEWTDLDLDGLAPRGSVPAGMPMWYVRAETRKRVGKIERERKGHLVPLSPLAVSILRQLQPVTGKHRRVFHKVSYHGHTDWIDAVRSKMAEQGFGEHWTPHDLRRTLSTGMGELGISEGVIGLVLSHDKKTLTGRVYDLSERLGERAEALRKWASHVAGLVGPKR